MISYKDQKKRLRVGFSHLNEHKFRHNFKDTTDPFCSCRTGEIEDTKHFLLCCPNYVQERLILFDDLKSLPISFLPHTCAKFCDILLYGSTKLENDDNRRLLTFVINYIIASKRFEGSLL